MENKNSYNMSPSFVTLELQEHPLSEPSQHYVAAGFSVSDIEEKLKSSGGAGPSILVNDHVVDSSYVTKPNDVVRVTCVPASTGIEWWIIAAIVVASAAITYALLPDIGGDIETTDDNTFNRISGLSNTSPLYSSFQAVLGKRKVAPVYVSRPYTTIEGDSEYFHALFSAGYGPLKLENFRIGETSVDDFDDVEVVVLDHYENTDETVIRDFLQQDIVQESVQIELREEEGWTNRTTESGGDYIVSNFLLPSGVFRYNDAGNMKTASASVRQDFQAENGDWYTLCNFHPVINANGKIISSYGGITEINGQLRRFTTDLVNFDTDNNTKVNENTAAFSYDYIEYDLSDQYDINGRRFILAKNVDENLHVASARKASADSSPLFMSTRVLVDDTLWPSGNGIPTRARKIYPSQTQSEDDSITGSITWENLQTVRPLSEAGFQEAIGYNRPDLYVDGVAIRTFRPTLIGVRMRATGQLNGNLDNFFVDATMCVPVDKDADWRDWYNETLEESTNPADAYKWLMQGPMNYSPIPPRKIDEDNLEDWRTRCDTEGWTISALIDYESTLIAELQKIAYLGRAEFRFHEGKFGVVEKIERTVPKQLFTPKNSANFQSKRTYPEVVDGVKFTFESEEADYETDSGFFLDPAKDPDSNGGDTSKLKGRYVTNDLWGVDNYDQAYRLSRLDYYEQFLQRELYTLDVDVEVLASSRGDLVRVSNDILNVGYGHGRITNISGTEITIDEVINTDSITTQMGVQIRSNQGVILTTDATYLGDGVWGCDTLDSSVSVGDLVVYGESGNETIDCIIRSIAYNSNLGATLTLVNSANEVFTYDGNPIPTYNPNVSLPIQLVKPPTPIIVTNTTDGTISLNVSHSGSTLADIYRAYVQIRSYPSDELADEYFDTSESGWVYVTQGEIAQSAFTLTNQARGLNYQLRVQYRSASGMVSDWSNVSSVFLPLSINLPSVNDLIYSHFNDGTYLIYSSVTDIEFDSYEIRTDTNFGTNDSAHVGTTKDDQFFLGLLTSDTTYYIAAKNIYGEYGDSSNVLVETNSPSTPLNFTVLNEGFGTRLSWEKSSVGYQIDTFEIKYTESGVGDVFASALDLGSTDGLTLTHSTSDRGVYWYYIRAVDIAGNASSWVSASVTVELSSTYINEQLDSVTTNLSEVTEDLEDLSFSVTDITNRSSDLELELLQSLSQQSASREELRRRLTEDEVLIDAAVYIDPSSGTIINRAYAFSEDLFNQASLEINGLDASIQANVESISLLEDEVVDLSSELALVPGQITATATSVVAEAIQALEPAYTFNFFDSAQDWEAVNGTITTPTPNQIDVTWGNIENDNLSFDAAENTLLKLTIERTGGTGWVGDVIIEDDNANIETFSGIIEDIPSGGEIIRSVSFQGLSDWDGTINRLRLTLGASASDTFVIKSITIGKPDAAYEEVSDLTVRITQAEVDINAVDGRVDTVVSDLQTFEDDTDDNFTTVNESLDAVNGLIENRAFEIVANRQEFEDDALQQLLNEIDSANYRIEDINRTVNFADAINQLQVDVSDEGALARSITSLEATTVEQGSAITANSELLQQVETDTSGNANSITSILSGVTGESNSADALLKLDAYLSDGGLGARAFLGTDVNDRITGVVINDSGSEQQIEFYSNAVAFVDENEDVKIYYDLVNQRYVFDGEIQASAGSFTGNVEADTGNIAGWEIETGLLTSAESGQRIELNANESKISVFDATNEKVVMGYLNGLPKNDSSGNWGSNDYGFWARSGDNLVIDGGIEYTSGDFLVQNDASVSIRDGSDNEIIRLGTDNGSKGTFVYDTSGDIIAEFSESQIFVGDQTTSLTWTSSDGLEIVGEITASSGTIGGWTITNNTLQNGNTSINSSNSTLAIGNDVSISPTDMSLGDSFSWSSANGLTVDSNATIAGWIVNSNLLKSANSGSRIELNANNNRVSIFDTTNEKVAMGYLNGLPKNDSSGNWTSNDYGFWARAGDTLTIDGSIDYNNGDLLIQNDASVKIRDGVSDNEIIRLGTDAGDKGLFIYDGSVSDGSSANQIAKFTDSALYLGSTNQSISWDSVGGLQVSGTISVGSQIGSETISNLQNRTTTAQNTADLVGTGLTTLINDLGDVAYDDLIELSRLGSTVISGGYILSNLIEADVILANTAVFNGSGDYSGNVIGNIDGEGATTLRNRVTTAQTTADTANTDLATLTNDLGDVAYDDLIELSRLGTTIIDGGYIKTDLIEVDEILGNNATFTGTVSGATVTGSNIIGTTYQAIDSVNSDYMTIISATPFGPNDLIEWYGPISGNISDGEAILANLTKTNATSWKDNQGNTYTSGTIIAGTLTVSKQNPAIENNPEIETGEFGSNGGQIAINCSFFVDANTGFQSGNPGASPVTPTVLLQLYRVAPNGTVLVNQETFTGTYEYIDEGNEHAELYAISSASFTFFDNLLTTTDREYRLEATITNVPLIGVTRQQRLSILTQEA